MLCSRLTGSADAGAGSFAHGKPADCESNVRHGFGVIERGSGWRYSPNPDIKAVTVSKDRATVRVTQPEGDWTADVVLLEQAGRWKLDALFGLPLTVAHARVTADRERAFPSARGRAVTLLDTNGKLCPELGDGRIEEHTNLTLPTVPEACRIRVDAGQMNFDLLTAFGDFSFAKRCEVSDFQFVVGRDGRTWMDYMNFTGPDNTGCGDVERCAERPQINPPRQGKLAPWKGRLTADGKGGFVHTMDACVATCVGFFTGRLTMRLQRRGGRWWLDADSARVGTSGFEFDGRVPVANERLRIRATG